MVQWWRKSHGKKAVTTPPAKGTYLRVHSAGGWKRRRHTSAVTKMRAKAAATSVARATSPAVVPKGGRKLAKAAIILPAPRRRGRPGRTRRGRAGGARATAP